MLRKTPLERRAEMIALQKRQESILYAGKRGEEKLVRLGFHLSGTVEGPVKIVPGNGSFSIPIPEMVEDARALQPPDYSDGIVCWDREVRDRQGHLRYESAIPTMQAIYKPLVIPQDGNVVRDERGEIVAPTSLVRSIPPEIRGLPRMLRILQHGSGHCVRAGADASVLLTPIEKRLLQGVRPPERLDGIAVKKIVTSLLGFFSGAGRVAREEKKVAKRADREAKKLAWEGKKREREAKKIATALAAFFSGSAEKVKKIEKAEVIAAREAKKAEWAEKKAKEKAEKAAEREKERLARVAKYHAPVAFVPYVPSAKLPRTETLSF